MEFENLKIGTLGWQHSNWVGGFYPDDMPEEWQLDFFSNQYQALLVSEKTWFDWTDESCEDIVDALPDGFALYLQVLNDMNPAKQEKLQFVQSFLADALIGLEVFSEFGEFANSYADLPVTLVSKSHELCGWNWSADGNTICSGAPCGVLSNLTEDAKAQTALLKSFMQSLPKDVLGAPLIICGGADDEEIDINQVNHLKTIAELMGY